MENAETTSHQNPLQGRLERWSSKAPSVKGATKARQIISEAVIKDLRRTQYAPLSLAEVQAMTSKTIRELESRTAGGKNILRGVHEEDPQVTTEILKEGDSWIAREIRSGENPTTISEAKIHQNGLTELTLDYPELGNDSNPAILREARFPTAAGKTFNLLVGSVKST